MSAPLLVRVTSITYNHAPYIRQCLDGFVMQKTNFRFEVVIHDDASNDGTQEIIKEYAAKYPDIIKPIFEDENQYSKGGFAAVTRAFASYCIEPAKYTAQCEGDDYWTDPLKLQKQVDYLEAHSECSCCVHDYDEWLDNESHFREHQIALLKNFSGKGLLLNIYDYVHKPFFTKTLTCVYRIDCLKNSNYSQYEATFDMPFFFALATQGTIYLMNEKMAVYRINNGGVTSDANIIAFQDRVIPGLFSMCRVETKFRKQAQQFVYRYIHDYILHIVMTQPSLFKACMKNLGFKNNIKLFLYDLPRIIIEIVSSKIKEILRLKKGI